MALVVEGSNPFTHPKHPATNPRLLGGPLAQLAEQVTLNHRVPGSSPGRLTQMTAQVASLWRRSADWTAFKAPNFHPNAG